MRTGRKILKYLLMVIESQKLELPVGSEILTVQVQRGAICLWANVDPDLDKYETREIIMHETDHPLFDNLDYISTMQLQDGHLVFHVFERCSNKKEKCNESK